MSSTIDSTSTGPRLSRTRHTLPFGLLSPADFERLCLWLVRREGYEQVEYWGEAGGDQGRDLVASRAECRIVFQCKRVRNLPPRAIEEEVRKILALSASEQPDELIFLATCAISSKARERARDVAGGHFACGFIALSELDERVKRHPDILEEFFFSAEQWPRDQPGSEVTDDDEEPPVPPSPDPRIFALSTALRACYEEEEELLKKGEPVDGVRERILELRRELRQGGQIHAGDDLVDRRFSLVEEIGEGGFGTVWKAYDRERRDMVAVKVLHSQYAEDASRRERFFRGARKMAELQHENVVRVVHEGVVDDGYCLYVMEFVDGCDLRRAVLEESISVEDALRVILDIAATLDHAHRRGTVHRDVKPANILLGGHGEVKLTDFDLVRDQTSTGGTRSGMLGTVVYASPEVMRNAAEAGPSADIYSLGMTAAFVVHGETLSLDVLRDTAAFVDRLEIRAAVRNVIQRAVVWEPAGRWSSMADFGEALRVGLEAPDPIDEDDVPPEVLPEHPSSGLRTPAVGTLPSSLSWREALTRLWRPFAIAAGFVAAVVGLVGLLLFSPLLRIRHVEVKAPLPDLETWTRGVAETRVGEQLMQLDRGTLLEKIESNPWIARASLTLNLPSTLRLLVEERPPRAKLVLEEGTLCLDGDGAVIAECGGHPRTDELLEIRSSFQAEPSDGLAVLSSVAELLRGPLTAIDHVELLPGGNLKIHSPDSPYPVLIEMSAPMRNRDQLEAIMPRLLSAFSSIATIDLRFERRIVLHGAVGAENHGLSRLGRQTAARSSAVAQGDTPR